MPSAEFFSGVAKDGNLGQQVKHARGQMWPVFWSLREWLNTIIKIDLMSYSVINDLQFFFGEYGAAEDQTENSK